MDYSYIPGVITPWKWKLRTCDEHFQFLAEHCRHWRIVPRNGSEAVFTPFFCEKVNAEHAEAERHEQHEVTDAERKQPESAGVIAQPVSDSLQQWALK